MVQEAYTYVDQIKDVDERLKLIDTLRTVTAGKVGYLSFSTLEKVCSTLWVDTDLLLDMIAIIYHDRPLIFSSATFWEKSVSHHPAMKNVVSFLFISSET